MSSLTEVEWTAVAVQERDTLSLFRILQQNKFETTLLFLFTKEIDDRGEMLIISTPSILGYIIVIIKRLPH